MKVKEERLLSIYRFYAKAFIKLSHNANLPHRSI